MSNKVNHFYTKSTEKFIEKMMRGDVSRVRRFSIINNYFELNKKTLEKITCIEKKLD